MLARTEAFRQPATPGLGRSIWAHLVHGFACLALMVRVRRERRALLALDERALKDLGLSTSDAYREATRAFTDLPARRRPLPHDDSYGDWL